MEQLTEQVALLTQQMATQENAFRIAELTRFRLTPDQIIRNFNEIPAFSGEDSYHLKTFLKNVTSVEELCGNGNVELRRYCLGKVINGKIIGQARNAILEIPDELRTWETVVETLTAKFKPKQTIYQLLFMAKEIKVYNIVDLFKKLTKIKSDANEICDYNNEDNFTYHSIDKELVQILKTKLIPIVQLQIDNEKTLHELENILCQSEIYQSEDAIKIQYRLSKHNPINKDQKQTHNSHSNRINQFQTYPNHQNNNGRNFVNSYNYTQNYRQNSNPNQYPGQYRPHFNNNSSNQNYGRPNNGFNNNNFGQNLQNRSGQFRNNRTENVPMEVDNINNENNPQEEVNFTD